MQAQTSSPRQANTLLTWIVAGLGFALMVLLLLSFMAEGTPSPSSEVAGTNTHRLAYLQFGRTADTLWLTDPASPRDGKALLEIPHAAEYGALPSLSPDGRRFAYTTLPEGLPSPRPDSPAQLWSVDLQATGGPTLLAEDVDLLVPPVWTPDGASVVYRRSTEGPHTLAIGPVDGGEERILAYSETDALFPVGFTGGGSLYYVGVNQDAGSRLFEVALSSGVATEVAILSSALTRDWKLSPDGSHVAYLEVAFEETAVASRASVLDISTGAITPLTSVDDVAFGPVWGAKGQLAIGVFNQATRDAGLLIVDGQTRRTVEGPVAGFDVPLAYSTSEDAYVVRAFANDSVTAPGRSTLVSIGPDGERRTIAEGEVTLVGWTHP